MAAIGLINYGAGNFTSVRDALEYLELDVVSIDRPGQMDEVAALVLPGVGAFARTMERLDQAGMVTGLQRQVEQGKPLLGICVGMQVLADIGHEFGETRGLGLVPGSVERLGVAGDGVRVPHMGWNDVEVVAPHPLFEQLPDPPTFYFAHSYVFRAAEPSVTLATFDSGGPHAAAVRRDNVLGVQFHPEKSQRDGLRLLRNFANMVT